MRIGVIQTNTGRNADDNIAELETLHKSLGNADLIITPECTNIMGYAPQSDRLVSSEDDVVVSYIRDWAKANTTYYMIGSALVLNEKGAPVNRQLLINPQGEIVSHFDKIHMFDVDLPNGEVFRESERTSAGERAVITEIDGHKFGHSICFDLRFPKLFSTLSQSGAEVLVVPAAFTQSTGRAHWETLLRARAIENGAYVIAPGQTGAYLHIDGTTRHCWGHSMVISPWGEILADLGEFPATRVIELDFEKVRKARGEIPVLQMAKRIATPKVIKL